MHHDDVAVTAVRADQELAQPVPELSGGQVDTETGHPLVTQPGEHGGHPLDFVRQLRPVLDPDSTW